MFIPNWTIALIIGAVVIYLWNESQNRIQGRAKFTPFFVQIHIKEELLKDYFALNEELIKDIYKHAWSKKGHTILNNGMMFSVVQEKAKYLLVFNNSHKGFSTRVDFEESIFDFDDNYSYDKLNTPPFSYSFWIQQMAGGFGLGVVTPESSKRTILAGDKNNRVPVALIPYQLFSLSDFRLEGGKLDKIKKICTKHGWDVDELHQDLKSDTVGHRETEIKNKYFNVIYGPI